MKVKIEQLIKDSGESLTISQLATEMALAGIFKNKKSAYDMLHYHINGKAKSCDWDLLKFLCTRFNRPGIDLIEWED